MRLEVIGGGLGVLIASTVVAEPGNPFRSLLPAAPPPAVTPDPPPEPPKPPAPSPPPPSSLSPEAPPLPSAPPPEVPFTVQAILKTNEGAYALLQQAGLPRWVQEGDVVAGWEVERLTAETVTVHHATRRLQLRPSSP